MAISREDRVSGYNYQSDSDDELEFERGNSGGGLRKMLEETLKENKKLLEKLEGKEREKSTASLLKDKGLDPAIAELIPADKDPKEWVEKYAHLLGVKDTQAEKPAVEPAIQMASDDDPALVAEREALAAMSNAAESGSPAETNDLLEQMNKISSEAELMKFFNSH